MFMIKDSLREDREGLALLIGDVSTAALHDEAEYEVGDLGVYLPRPITLQITASSNN